MVVLNIENVSYSIGVKKIIENISFFAESGDKIGIIGVNGAGKSTLLKIITGEISQDSGNVSVGKNSVVGILKQDQNPALNENDTVFISVSTVFNHLKIIENRITIAEKELTEYNAEKHEQNSEELDYLQKLLDTHDKLIKEYTEKGGFEYQNKIKSTLEFLGFKEESWEQKVSTLSGGQKTRLGLIKLFLSEPDILLLDEPTNHVDINSLDWLEKYIKSYPKTVLLVSHDRYFLDNTVNKIIEIENNNSMCYKGNYTDYVNRKAEDREIRQHQYDVQQREIKRIEDMIEQLKRWGREKQIKQARSKQKSIDRMEKIEKPSTLPDKIKLSFGDKKINKSLESGNDVLSVVDLAKSFPPKVLFENLNFEVKKHDNLFIIGDNGTGKSTLLKILTGQLETDRGYFEFGYNVKIGYYDQENQHLDDENTVLDELWDNYDDMKQLEVRNVLASFLFRQDDVQKGVKVLSGGEKARLTFAKLILQKCNALLLDEPTNHLDINSREALETSLLAFKGTIIAVSHDRYFIKKLSTRILELGYGSYIDYKDNYEEFIRYKTNFLSGGNTEQVKSLDTEKEKKIEEFEIQRIQKKQREQLEREFKFVEGEISKTEKRIAELEYMIKDDEVVADYKRLNIIYEEKIVLEENLEKLYERFYHMEQYIDI